MFKEEIPKLRDSEERNLDKIRMTHRLMDGNLNILTNQLKTIK
jgi:hypothetical protein